MGYILWWPSLKDTIIHTNDNGLGNNLDLGEIGRGTIASIKCRGLEGQWRIKTPSNSFLHSTSVYWVLMRCQKLGIQQ